MAAIAICILTLPNAVCGEEAEDFEVHLWPLLESTELASGARRTSALLVYHKTVMPSGETYSFHAGPYFRGPDYKFIFPLAYTYGPPGARHSGLVPFCFSGPGYRVVPPLLYGRWKHADDAESKWVTPLFHRTREPDGSLRHMHALNYFQGKDWKVFFPFAYQVGEHVGVPPFYFRGPGYKFVMPLAYSIGEKGRRHSGLVPLYFRGPGYEVCTPLLTAWWRHRDGSTSSWWTPFVHRTVDREGELRNLHVLNYFQGPGWKVFFPFFYQIGEHAGVPPFYFRGPDYWASPTLASGWWKHADGAESTWITPLFHRTVDKDGKLRHMHALNYFRGRDWEVFFPFGYRFGERAGVGPFYLAGPGYRTSPALLSGWWKHADGAESTWITPLFHRTVDRDGTLRHMHALNYFQGADWKVFFPLGYQTKDHAGVIPIYFRGKNYKISPPLLSAWWRHRDGAESTWITPLFHQTLGPEGEVRHAHFLSYMQGKNWKSLAPLYLQWKGADGTTRSIVPGLYWGWTDAQNTTCRSILPPLFWYRRGAELDKSPAFQARPFSFQRAGRDRELNVLWRMFHFRREGTSTRVMVGPFWMSERPERGKPARVQVLGGLLARDCNYDRGTYRYRVLWLFPVGPRRRFRP
jgi:hypothetical protein